MSEKVVTFSFDDCEDYDRRLCDLFRKYGMKATFFLISNELSKVWENYKRYGEITTINRVSPEEIPITYSGMEVASHTQNHRCSVDDIEETVVKSAQYLSSLCGYDVVGLGYPGGEYTHALSEAIGKAGIKYARTTRCTYGFEIPENWLEWHPTCSYNDPQAPDLIDKFIAYDGDAPALLNIYGHSYEMSENLPDRNFDYFEGLLKKLSSHKDIKCMTYREVYDRFSKD